MVRERVWALATVLWLVIGFTAVGWSQTPYQLPRGYKTFTDSARQFTFDHPGNWKLAGGVRNFVVTLVESGVKGWIVVEHVPTTSSAPDTLGDGFVNQVVLAELRASQPGIQNVQPSRLKDRPRVIVVDFTRTGINGNERLRQYVLAEGTVFVRMTCIAPEKEFEKQRKTFETVANSLRVLPKAG